MGQPAAGLIMDGACNLYGTTVGGGTYGNGYGTVFELTPAAGGTWTEKVLHSFGSGADGTEPDAGLIFDAAGNLYGTTGGGIYRLGTVFELMPAAGGTWTEKVLYSFNGGGADGYGPDRRRDLRWRRQSLRHDRGRRHLHRRYGVRVDACSGRNLDGEGVVELRQRY